MKWTDKQLDVINTRDRNILVSAAAGSGKTAVLVERIIKMITDKENPVDIDQLLVVTFTRAAASEMRERIREALENLAEKEPDNINVQKQLSFIHNAKITTIDSFCASVVKENFDKIDLDPNFRIADETEIDMLKTDILENMLEEYYEQGDEGFIKLARQYSAGKLSDNLGELIVTVYNKASGHYNPEKWVRNCGNCYFIENPEELENSRWIKEYLDSLRCRMESWISNLNKGKIISESADGPKFGTKIDDYIDKIELLMNADTYTKMRKEIRQFDGATWRAAKGCDEDKKKQVSKIKKDINDAIKDIKNKDLQQSIDQLYKDICDSRDTVKMITELTLEFMKRFQAEKAEKGIMDFNDQAHFALEILTNEDADGNLVPSETAREMSHNFREIMIDEYQDSNYIQEAILSSVSGGFGVNNMFMVGDVKQSIYRFRQAEPKLFIGKYDTYSEDLTADNCKIILDRNFRSRREVINSVNYLFNYIMHRQVGGIDYVNGNQLVYGNEVAYDKSPDSQSNNTEFVIIEGNEKKTEAEYVAQKIKEITDPVTGMKITENGKGMRPVKYGDIAILLRSMKGVSEIYQEQLENNGIPSFAESKTGYYEALEVKTILSMLSIIDNPRQDIPLAAVLVSPMFEFSSDELAIIKTENECTLLYDNLRLYAENGNDEHLKNKTDNFLKIINEFRMMVPYTNVYEMINQILDVTGYEYYIRSMPNGKRRYLNIEALKEKAVAYDSISYKGLFNFIRYIEKVQYLAKDDGEASEVGENDDIVRIMSIHKSKGLQFPVVFVCNTAGRFNVDTEKIVTDDKGNIGIDCIDDKLKIKNPTIFKRVIKQRNKEEDIAETLRILYVALTRAKEKLFITGIAKDTNKLLTMYDGYKYETNDLMLYDDIVGTGNMMDWIGKAIGRNRDADCNINISNINGEDIIFSQFQQEITDEIKAQYIQNFRNVDFADNEIQDMFLRYFDFSYPYEEDIIRSSKASVTEIKKQSMAYDEEQDGTLMHEKQGPDLREENHITEIIPDFIKKQLHITSGLSGAQRGTAYHRIFELMDMHMNVYSFDSVSEMIENFVASGMIDRDSADSIKYKDIIKFTESNLFSRMRDADSRGELCRERKFLMGMPASGDDIMIIQGIIDGCFLENGEYVIMDYKTDKVDKTSQLVEKYHVQLECYKTAIEQISGIRVKEMIIYSVYLGEEVSLG